jgi:membrane associated rhomboid family serine protease
MAGSIQLLQPSTLPVSPLFHPAILVLFQRDFTRFMHGEWWQLVTPLFVQDGGVPGTSFNMVSLLLVGILAEKLCGSLPVLLIFFIGGILGEIASLAWQPIGAGNSVANFA